MFCYRGHERRRGYFTVFNSLADMSENPCFQHFMPLWAAGSDLSGQEASSSLYSCTCVKKNTQSRTQCGYCCKNKIENNIKNWYSSTSGSHATCVRWVFQKKIHRFFNFPSPPPPPPPFSSLASRPTSSLDFQDQRPPSLPQSLFCCLDFH